MATNEKKLAKFEEELKSKLKPVRLKANVEKSVKKIEKKESKQEQKADKEESSERFVANEFKEDLESKGTRAAPILLEERTPEKIQDLEEFAETAPKPAPALSQKPYAVNMPVYAVSKNYLSTFDESRYSNSETRSFSPTITHKQAMAGFDERTRGTESEEYVRGIDIFAQQQEQQKQETEERGHLPFSSKKRSSQI